MSDEVWPVLAASNLVLVALGALQDLQENVIFSSGTRAFMGESANRKFEVILHCL
jgi:hypothetical protein